MNCSKSQPVKRESKRNSGLLEIFEEKTKNFQKSVDRRDERAYTNEIVSSEAADTAETLK